MAECSTCHAVVHWLKTSKGKNMCVDMPMPHAASTRLFEHGVHIPHFTTCPDADQHRRPKTAKQNVSTQQDRQPGLKLLPPEYYEWAEMMEATGHLRRGDR